MKKLFLLSTAIFFSRDAFSCITCNKALQQGIYNSTFYPNLLSMLSAFIVLTILLILLIFMAIRRYKAKLRVNDSEANGVPLLCAGAVLGMGLGGFADGIALHQVLQWHEMLTNKIPADTLVNKSINMFWDGIFHSFTLVTTLIGVYLLFRVLHQSNTSKSGYVLSGGMLIGWGLFNLVEGIIDHQILKLHNVYEYTLNKDLFNYGFLLFGIILLAAGWMLFRKGEEGSTSMTL